MMTNDIRAMYDKLELEPRNSKERQIVCDSIDSITLSGELMEFTKSIVQLLEDEMQTNNETANEILTKIRKISEKLRLPCDLASKQREFYSTRIVGELQEELTQLEQERKKHMKLFIESASTELEQEWTKCFASDKDKIAFNAKVDKNLEDEEYVLEQYENETQIWKKYYDQHQLIISKVKEWYTLWEDKLQLETCKNDPGRLGNFKALREEEKRENRVKKRLPKVVEEIERLAKQYKSETAKEFLICGMIFTDMNHHQQAKHDQDVQRERDKKKMEKERLKMHEHTYGSLPPSKTPLRGNRTMRQVKRLQHETKLIGKVNKTRE